MKVEPFGELKFRSKYQEWFGQVINICPGNKVELSISAANQKEDISEKIELVRQLSADYESIVSDLYDLAYKKYKNTEFEVTRKEIEQMYFLTAVDLKADNKTWWLVLEPYNNVGSIYDQFLRFTMVDRKIIWANFDVNTTA